MKKTVTAMILISIFLFGMIACAQTAKVNVSHPTEITQTYSASSPYDDYAYLWSVPYYVKKSFFKHPYIITPFGRRYKMWVMDFKSK
jgi:hypothetical protein